MEPFRAALDDVEIAEPAFPVFSCASAAPFTDVRAELADALIKPVRWAGFSNGRQCLLPQLARRRCSSPAKTALSHPLEQTQKALGTRLR